jgi:hypothetical protein
MVRGLGRAKQDLLEELQTLPGVIVHRPQEAETAVASSGRRWVYIRVLSDRVRVRFIVPDGSSVARVTQQRLDPELQPVVRRLPSRRHERLELVLINSPQVARIRPHLAELQREHGRLLHE